MAGRPKPKPERKPLIDFLEDVIEDLRGSETAEVSSARARR